MSPTALLALAAAPAPSSRLAMAAELCSAATIRGVREPSCIQERKNTEQKVRRLREAVSGVREPSCSRVEAGG
jgi:hypothetical protein